ncbi:hypothetical protein AcV7_006332 [Taiwanofungus camphoratus]|nr:hypothetical protein AcV7_006332 [Antrodia cinnamomea]
MCFHSRPAWRGVLFQDLHNNAKRVLCAVWQTSGCHQCTVDRHAARNCATISSTECGLTDSDEKASLVSRIDQ